MLVRLLRDYSCMKTAHVANVDQQHHQGSAAFKPAEKRSGRMQLCVWLQVLSKKCQQFGWQKVCSTTLHRSKMRPFYTSCTRYACIHAVLLQHQACASSWHLPSTRYCLFTAQPLQHLGINGHGTNILRLRHKQCCALLDANHINCSDLCHVSNMVYSKYLHNFTLQDGSAVLF